MEKISILLANQASYQAKYTGPQIIQVTQEENASESVIASVVVIIVNN